MNCKKCRQYQKWICWIMGICLIVGMITGCSSITRQINEEFRDEESSQEYHTVQSSEEETDDEVTQSSEEFQDEVVQNHEESDSVEESFSEEISVGDLVTYGSYEQDGDLSNGTELMEWVVLDQQDGKVLLLSNYVIDAIPYHAEADAIHEVTWENCSVRDWLNTEFYQSAFSEEEQAKIITTTILNQDNEKYGTRGGKKTKDKVFLLSLEEVDKYLVTKGRRVTESTAYLLLSGKASSEEHQYQALWWLRSPGCDMNAAAYVDKEGCVSEFGMAHDAKMGVRPAMWVQMNELLQNEENRRLNEETSVGDIVIYGSYPESLEWIVLDQQDGNALLLSRYVIDFRAYDETGDYGVTWANCTLRNWLNTEFYGFAFNEEEQLRIMETEVFNQDNEEYGTPGGDTTSDKVFLLSLNEIGEYTKSSDERTTTITAYAFDSWLGRSIDEVHAAWWLRSPGNDLDTAAYIDTDGMVYASGHFVTNYASQGVRPAMWVQMDDDELIQSNENLEEGERKGDLNEETSVGDIVLYGKYEQDNNLNNGVEPLEWVVLDQQDEKVLLLSNYVIDVRPYHAEAGIIPYSDADTDHKTTWEKCILRDWLNTEFYQSAFSEEEQLQIVESEVLNHDNTYSGTPGGEDTYDKVFMLSLDEIVNYFSMEEEAMTKATAYAADVGVRCDYEQYAEWWLRTPGSGLHRAIYVGCDGSIHTIGVDVATDDIGIRPAMWVSR